MSETKKAPLGHGIWKKVVSWLMIMAMIIGLAPANFTLVANAEETTTKPTIRIYFENSDNWEGPAINVWDTGATVKAGDPIDIKCWKDDDATTDDSNPVYQKKPALLKDEASGLYYADITSDSWIGFQIVDGPSYDWDDDKAQKVKILEVNKDNAEDNKVLGGINALEDGQAAYYLPSKGGWFADAEGKTPLAQNQKL